MRGNLFKNNFGVIAIFRCTGHMNRQTKPANKKYLNIFFFTLFVFFCCVQLLKRLFTRERKKTTTDSEYFVLFFRWCTKQIFDFMLNLTRLPVCKHIYHVFLSFSEFFSRTSRRWLKIHQNNEFSIRKKDETVPVCERKLLLGI